jgi:hypothetical protein
MAETPCSNDELSKGLTELTRNKYFYGKLMDAFHFTLEQKYLNRKRWLLNQLALGSGVLCGLQVAPTTDGKQVVVGPGVAIDNLGREIIVPSSSQSQSVDPRQPTDFCGRPSGDRITGAEIVHICLAYHECEAEPVPVLVGECETRAGCANSLIRERYRIIVRKGTPTEINPTCGFQDPFAQPQAGEPSALYSQLVGRISQRCAEPQVDPCVVLAQINLPEADAEITAGMIDLTFRPVVYSNELLFELLVCLAQQVQEGGATPTPNPELTTITELSWNHDEELDLDAFITDGLTVTFSDTVTASARQNDAWFIVTVEYAIGNTEAQPPALLSGTVFVQRVLAENINVNGNKASFKPSEAFKEAFSTIVSEIQGDLRPLCRVVLKCNALIGANDRAVDGNFLCGVLPSGDGIPGGDFESWFTLNRR